MVDRTNIAAITALSGELQLISDALAVFDANGRIINLTVASELDDPMARRVQFATDKMTYPPQMIDAIKGFLLAREQEISDELSGLGVSGVSESPKR